MRWIIGGATAGFLATLVIVLPLVAIFNPGPVISSILGLSVSIVLSNLGMYVGVRIEDRRASRRLAAGMWGGR